MKYWKILKRRKIIIVLFSISIFLGINIYSYAQVFENLSAIQCDSLINANVDNPNFVILDVRRPSEYTPQHLEKAINRNYYDADFDDQLNSLIKQKIYLIHCKAGSRSGATFNIMQTLDFVEVYNMVGGINAWNSESLPTSSEFAPEIMFVSDSIFPLEVITIGEIDTITIKITNRANSSLSFNTISSLDDSEFNTDFDIDTTLFGAEDYSFNIFYEPSDEVYDSISFFIESNIGTITASIHRTGIDNTLNTFNKTISEINIYPNPASDFLHIVGLNSEEKYIELLNMQGKLVYSNQIQENKSFIDISSFQKGVYCVKVTDSERITSKIVIFE